MPAPGDAAAGKRHLDRPRQSGRTALRPSPRPVRLIYDPDPSLLRAGLLDGFACEHNLSRLAEGVDYLTADHLVTSPFLTAFELREVSSLDLKALKRLVAKHEIGTLEIKVRGARRDPRGTAREAEAARHAHGHAARRRRGRGAAKAILAQRVSTGRIGDFFVDGLSLPFGTGDEAAVKRRRCRRPAASSAPAQAAQPIRCRSRRAERCVAGAGVTSNRFFTSSSQSSSGIP